MIPLNIVKCTDDSILGPLLWIPLAFSVRMLLAVDNLKIIPGQCLARLPVMEIMFVAFVQKAGICLITKNGGL